MSKRFYLRLPTTLEKIVITVDETDAFRLRSEAWKVKKHKGWIEVYRQHLGVTLGLGREILGIKKDGVCATHNNGDSTDFRRANLTPMDQAAFIKQKLLPAVESKRGWTSNKCKRGHLLIAENIVLNGKCGPICAVCAKERKRASGQEKRGRFREQVRAGLRQR